MIRSPLVIFSPLTVATTCSKFAGRGDANALGAAGAAAVLAGVTWAWAPARGTSPAASRVATPDRIDTRIEEDSSLTGCGPRDKGRRATRICKLYGFRRTPP